MSQDNIFLLLAMMALAQVPSIEKLRCTLPGEWGNLLGLDRVPEVRALREKLALLNEEVGQAAQWNTRLARDWMGQLPEGETLGERKRIWRHEINEPGGVLIMRFQGLAPTRFRRSSLRTAKICLPSASTKLKKPACKYKPSASTRLNARG